MNDLLYIRYDGVNKLKGIANKLRENDILFDEIIPSSSSIYSSQYPQNVLIDDSYLIFTSEGGQNSWITFSFVNKKLYLKSYAIKVIERENTKGHFPVHWVIRGSSDNITWKLIDKKDTNIFQEIGQIEVIDCNRPSAYQHIQMQMDQICLDLINLSFLEHYIQKNMIFIHT